METQDKIKSGGIDTIHVGPSEERARRSAARNEYYDAVLKEVKFFWDHDEITKELDEHILEESAYLRARGMTDKEAEDESIRRMGDARNLGKMFNQVHNPWIGWIWIATSILAVCLVLSLGKMVLKNGISDLRYTLWEMGQTPAEAAEAMIEGRGEKELYHVSCNETLELDTFQIRFTDVYCTYMGKPVSGIDEHHNYSKIYLCYEITGEEGQYGAHWMNEETFLNEKDDPVVGAIVPLDWTPTLENTDPNFVWWYNKPQEGVFEAYSVNPDTACIQVNYNIFGKEARCRIDLTEGRTE